MSVIRPEIAEVRAALQRLAGREFETQTGSPFLYKMDSIRLTIQPRGGHGNERIVSTERLNSWIERWFIDEERDVAGYVSKGAKGSPSSSFRGYLSHVFKHIGVQELGSHRASENVSTSSGLNVLGAGESAGVPRVAAPMTINQLLDQLEHRRIIGDAGERIALDYERRRLIAMGCPNPETAAVVVSSDNVGLGYDLQSSWAGEQRKIEVKTNVRALGDMFLTENEWHVLAALGSEAWIYRVVLDPNGSGGEVVETIQDPMSRLNEAEQRAVLWRIGPRGFAAAAETDG